MTEGANKLLSDFIVDRVGFGVFAVNTNMEVVL